MWWPTLIDRQRTAVLERHFDHDCLPSRHRSVPADVWRAVAPLLPSAKLLAGSFANGSGPNCFGTVLAAAGVPGAVDEWVLQALFEDWLARHCRTGGHDNDPGTVLVWRDSADRTAQHAAVTLGGGWAFQKQSQCWDSPRQALGVRELIRHLRTPGRTLQRYTMLATAGSG